ncbi:MAG: anhydro-N-acetylmuramic acid kinase [Bryobacteraceae bacterium]
MRVAGIMSGTSLDGIDVAIVDISGRGWNKRVDTRAFRTTPYPAAVREAILGVSNTATHTAGISRLHFLLGELYARAVRLTCEKGGIPLSSLNLVACHGQTVFHEGEPVKYLGHSVASTLQIGEASIIAERLGVPVVSDFRPRDIAAGGRGAPLVPFVDYLLFRHRRLGRVVLNIGGIANISAIPPGAAPDDVLGFDTGPGNMILDALAAICTEGAMKCDRGGRLAARGHVNRPLLDRLLAEPYYRRKPPKTAGREQYGREFVDQLLETGMPVVDLLATATVLTAATIAGAIERFVRPRMSVDELIVSGGGARNPQILTHLTALLQDVAIATSNDYGIDLDAKEAIAFAVLGHETWNHRPSNLPSATGARRPVILGKITQ